MLKINQHTIFLIMISFYMTWTASVCQLLNNNSCKVINNWQNFTMYNKKKLGYEGKINKQKNK